MDDSEPISVLINLFSEYGINKSTWKSFYSIIQNSKDNLILIKYINNILVSQPNNEFTPDVIDFIIDFGNNDTIKLIASNDFLIALINLLQIDMNVDVQIQMKVIILIQKWAIKFQNSNFKSFNECYQYLINNGIVFPPKEQTIDTYNKYINPKDLVNYDNLNINEYQNNNYDPFNIDDLNPIIKMKSYDQQIPMEKVYKAFSINNDLELFVINKNKPSNSDEMNKILMIKEKWCEKIKNTNNILDKEKDPQNLELQASMNELIQALDLILSLIKKYDKFRDIHDILIQIRNDIEMTIYRYNLLESYQKVIPFYSAFDGNKQRYDQIYHKNNQKKTNNNILNNFKNGIFSMGRKFTDFVNNAFKSKEDSKNNNSYTANNYMKNNNLFNPDK